jgi:hypothetical protein
VLPDIPVALDSARATRETDEAFFEIIFGDDELVRAEFDAIIAAQWPCTPPPREPDDGAVADRGRRPARPRHEPSGSVLPNRRRYPGGGRWCHGRSPPRTRQQVHIETKGRW